eukprot:5001397-Pleurochrysis_carterae.AAC.1
MGSFDDGARHARRGRHLIVEGYTREVVNVYLYVPRCCVPRLRWDVTGTLELAPAPCPALHCFRWWLLRVEGRLPTLHPRRHERRDPFEPVGRERAPEAHAPVHNHARPPLVVPPYEALDPPVRPLYGAKAVGGLRIYYPRCRPRASLAVGRITSRPVDEGHRPRQLLHSG